MFKRRRLIKKQRQVADEYDRHIKDMTEAKAPREEIQSVESEAAHELFEFAHEMRVLDTRKLLGHAARHYIPTPAFGKEPYWERHPYLGTYCLTDEGMKEVRQEIHDFWKRRAELWVMLGTVLIGLIGATTGLLAVVLR